METTASPSSLPVLRNRTFLIVWVGQSISGLGNNLFGMALLWWVVKETGSGAAMSVTALATALPRIVLGPMTGVLVDRYDRRVLMALADFTAGLVTLGAALLYWRGVFSFALIITAAAILSAIAAFHEPSFQASVPVMVGANQLVRANSLMQSAQSAIGILAPALAGIIIGATGVGMAVFLDAISFFVASFSLFTVNFPSPRGADRQRMSVWREAGTGFAFIFKHRLLFPMLIFNAMINLAVSPANALIALLVTQVLHAGPQFFGVLGSAQSAGILGGSLLLASFPRLVTRAGLSVILFTVAIGLAVAAFGLIPTPIAYVIAIAAAGFLMIMIGVAGQSIWQTEVPDQVRGRVFAARMAMGSGLMPLGLALAGPLSDWLGLLPVFTWAGLSCAAVGLAGFGIPGLASYVPKQWGRGAGAAAAVAKQAARVERSGQ